MSRLASKRLGGNTELLLEERLGSILDSAGETTLGERVVNSIDAIELRDRLWVVRLEGGTLGADGAHAMGGVADSHIPK